jgi:large subunit ribosomal protein L22
MEANATTKYIRVSPFKAREVIRQVHGKKYSEAISVVTLTTKKAGGIIKKTLLSAYANAEQKGADVTKLFVKEAVIGEGPTMKRFRPKARGSAGRILKRTSHIKIVLSDEI